LSRARASRRHDARGAGDFCPRTASCQAQGAGLTAQAGFCPRAARISLVHLPRRLLSLIAVAAPCLVAGLSAQNGPRTMPVPHLTPTASIAYGDSMMAKGRYREAVVAYQRARMDSPNEAERVRAGIGEVTGILRMAGFSAAVDESAALLATA